MWLFFFARSFYLLARYGLRITTTSIACSSAPANGETKPIEADMQSYSTPDVELQS